MSRPEGKAHLHKLSYFNPDNLRPNDFLKHHEIQIVCLLLKSTPDLKRGDIIRSDNEADSDNLCFIYDGNRLKHIQNGCIPFEFKFPEFPFEYWKGLVKEDNRVWVDLFSFQKEIVKNVRKRNDKFTSSFTYNGVTYPIVNESVPDKNKFIESLILSRGALTFKDSILFV